MTNVNPNPGQNPAGHILLTLTQAQTLWGTYCCTPLVNALYWPKLYNNNNLPTITSFWTMSAHVPLTPPHPPSRPLTPPLTPPPCCQQLGAGCKLLEEAAALLASGGSPPLGPNLAREIQEGLVSLRGQHALEQVRGVGGPCVAEGPARAGAGAWCWRAWCR